ncbi:MAG: peptide ABC transporter substrate-binding protein [Firmicutes bacterium]|nr:peptide ABC transporter substrate-binding protein [Bacillota bacterium]
MRAERGYGILSCLAALAVLAVLLVSVGFVPEHSVQAAGKTLSIIVDAESDRADEAEIIATYLRAVGVEAEVRIWEWNALKERLVAGERQMYLSDWGSAYFDPFDLVIPKLGTADRGNYSGYSNKELDELLTLVQMTADQSERKKAYFEAQRIIFQDAPWVFGYALKETEAARGEITSWQPSMDSRMNLHDVGITRGDTIVVGMKADKIITLDPAMYRDRSTETVLRNMFDGLVTRTWDGKVVPEIAESWTVPSDNTYVFKLRKDVKFHNGDALDADDVVFTFKRVLEDGAIAGQSSPRKGLLGPLEAVEKIDQYTVKFTLANPFPIFPQALVHFQIVPKDYIQKVGDNEFAAKPIGAGPFKFKEGRLDDQIVMERFDEYYGGSREIPPVGVAPAKRAIFRMMPEATVRVAALKAGEVHIIQQLPPDLAKTLSADKNIQVKSVDGTRVYCVELNCQKPPFDDVRVRRAMNYAVDWDAILKSIYGGNGTRLACAFLPSGFGFDPDLAPYPYDPEKAKALLREAGYSVK